MRAVSGTRWGADHKSLLTIYRTLVRSVLDYGAAAYDSASTTQLQKLDRVQYSALKLCYGAMTTTAASALQVESGETPLKLRRLQQQIKFAINVKATTAHVAQNVLEDHWTTHYGRFNDNNRPLAVKVSKFFENIEASVAGVTLGNIPPWQVVAPNIDLSLTKEVSKKEAPNVLAILARDKIDQQYGDYVQIYTDASKDTSGRVGIGCHILSTSTFQGTDKVARLTDGVAVHTGELAAIRMALENVRQLEHTTTHRRYAIFTDSLSTINNFISNQSLSRPNLLVETVELLQNINSQVTLIWVPSHVGIPGLVIERSRVQLPAGALPGSQGQLSLPSFRKRTDWLILALNDKILTSTLDLKSTKPTVSLQTTSTSRGSRNGTLQQLVDTSTMCNHLSVPKKDLAWALDQQKYLHTDYDWENVA